MLVEQDEETRGFRRQPAQDPSPQGGRGEGGRDGGQHQADCTERPDRPDRPDRRGRPGRPDCPGRPDRPDPPGRPGCLDRPGRPERPEGRPGRRQLKEMELDDQESPRAQEKDYQGEVL